MCAETPRISIMIISYKQEGIIHRALDSLLTQKDYIYEICVSDDCSPDNTWQVLQDYKKRHPDIIKLHRNETNKGIFENIEQVHTMPTGDIVMSLAGDDAVGEGWLKTVAEYIMNNHIDYKHELFCIYGNYKCIYPNGDTVLHSNRAVSKYDNVFRLALRGIINGRGCCYSRHILEKFHKVSQGRSHIAENAQDRQLQAFAETNYYIPKVGNVYYSAIGISVHLTEEMKYERMQIWPYSIKCFEEQGIDLSKSDLMFIKHRMAYQEYTFWGKKKKALISIWYYIKSFDLKLFWSSDQIRGWFFAIRRRLPHKRAINMA